MFVSDWMTRKVFTVTPDDGLYDAIKLLKEKKIKHIPVVKKARLKGILSDRDLRTFSPSKATSFDAYELHYLLVKVRVKEIMKTKVITTTSDTAIEEAAELMHDKNIGCLPVLEDSELVGIISDKDIFRALVDITGVRHGGSRVYLTIEDKPGSIKDVADVIRKYGFSLQSILTSYERVPDGYRNIVIRTKGKGQFGGLKSELLASYKGARILKG